MAICKIFDFEYVTHLHNFSRPGSDAEVWISTFLICLEKNSKDEFWLEDTAKWCLKENDISTEWWSQYTGL